MVARNACEQGSISLSGYCCTRGFEFGRSGWGAERFRSLMLFVLVFAIFELPEDVHFLVNRERTRLRKRKWLRAMHVNRVVFVEWLLLYAWV
jgi:hypothetical protein